MKFPKFIISGYKSKLMKNINTKLFKFMKTKFRSNMVHSMFSINKITNDVVVCYMM